MNKEREFEWQCKKCKKINDGQTINQKVPLALHFGGCGEVYLLGKGKPTEKRFT